MVCDIDVCERWCVTKMCVKDGVWQRCVWKVVCDNVARLPRKRTIDVAKCHACHAKQRWMSPSATPATWKCRGATGDQRRPSAPPDPAQSHKCHASHAKPRSMSPSATPAMWNEGGCRQMKMLCDKDVCERWCVTKMCVCVKDGVWRRGGGRTGEAEDGRYRSTRTPHNVVGKKGNLSLVMAILDNVMAKN